MASSQSVVQNIAGVSVVTTAETILATSPAANYNVPGGQGNEVRGVINMTAGASTTLVTVRVHQGTTIAGPLVGAAVNHTLAATATAQIAYSAVDPTTSANGLQYIVTIQQTGASGNGSVQSATLAVLPSTSAF